MRWTWIAAVLVAAACGGGGDDPRLAFELVAPRGARTIHVPTASLRLEPSGTAGDLLELGGRRYRCVATGDTAQRRELGAAACRAVRVDDDHLIVPFAGLPRPWFVDFDDGAVGVDGYVEDAGHAGPDTTARARLGPLELVCAGAKPGDAARLCAALRAR